MRVLSTTNTAWRDRYGRAWGWALAFALAFHALLFLWLPRAIVDRLHEAMIPAPIVFVTAGSGTGEMEVVALAGSSSLEAPVEEPAEEAVEEVEIPVPVEEAPEETTIAPTTEAPSAGEEAAEEGSGTAEEGEGPGAGGTGGGGIASPRPLHLVVPRLPSGVDRRRAHGESVHLLVQVLPDGTVGEVKVEKGSRIAALDQAAIAAARQMRYVPATRAGEGIAQWTRTEMRF